MNETIDIRRYIDSQAISPALLIVAALCFTVVLADGMDVALMGFVAPSILRAWHVSRQSFGLVMSAAPVGLVFGALGAGQAADLWGRKPVLTASVLLVGLFTTAAAFSANPVQLGLLRLAGGVGMGAAMPNALTLMAELSPSRRRALLITIMFTGFNFGSALIGFAAAALIPTQGWRAVPALGGLVPLLLSALLLLLLPESPLFLAAKGVSSARIAATLRRATGVAPLQGAVFLAEKESAAAPTHQAPLASLFAPDYTLTTLALWATCFLGLLVIYLLTGWLPTLLQDAGFTVRAAANVTALFQLGGSVGAILVGWLMDRTKPSPIISAAYLLGGLCILGLGLAGIHSALAAVLVLCAGFCMSGAQTGLNAFAPGCYPTAARASGVGWMLSAGRLGNILGSAAGGALLATGWSFSGVLTLLAAPAVLAAATIMAPSLRRPRLMQPRLR